VTHWGDDLGKEKDVECSKNVGAFGKNFLTSSMSVL